MEKYAFSALNTSKSKGSYVTLEKTLWRGLCFPVNHKFEPVPQREAHLLPEFSPQHHFHLPCLTSFSHFLQYPHDVLENSSYSN